MTIKGVVLTVGFLLLVVSSYTFGYVEGKKTAEYHALKEHKEAVNQILIEEQRKHEEVIALNKSLTTDNANLNRLLRSKNKQPVDLQQCNRERLRLRFVVRQLSLCITKCREGIGYANIQ